jgi:phosphatidylinositol dimannoside acyltransferase
MYYLARSGNTLARWTPQSARQALGSFFGAASYLSWPSKRLVTQLNMAQVTGRSAHDPHVRRLAFASWRNYGRYAADFLHFPHLDISAVDRHLHDLTQGASSWMEHIEHALESGRGIIIATAHFGNWDVAGGLLARHLAASAVAETFSDTQLNRLLQDQRKQKGLGIIPMEGSARRILRVLQQNQAVAIAVDRPVKQDEGTAVTFFGRKTYVPSGPAALALKSGAAIIPGYVWYGHRNQFHIRAFPPIFPQESKGEERASEIARLTQRMYDALEEIVREWPTQWYMFRQFWPAE